MEDYSENYISITMIKRFFHSLIIFNVNAICSENV